jgi:hypothetical protein
MLYNKGMSIADTATATPAQIDAELAELYTAKARAQGAKENALRILASIAEDKIGYRSYQAADYQARVEAANAEIAQIREAAAPLEAEYVARGRWTRAYLVDNSNGHVHNTTGCGTCFPTTTFAWMTEYSGKDEAEIVEAAGERACTVCYPSAPVEALARPTRMFTKDEIAAQERREALAAKKAQAAKDAVIDPATGKVLYKTERGATNAVATELDSAIWYGPTHPMYNEWIALLDRVSIALGARQNREAAEVRAELVAKAEKKAKAPLGGKKCSY